MGFQKLYGVAHEIIRPADIINGFRVEVVLDPVLRDVSFMEGYIGRTLRGCFGCIEQIGADFAFFRKFPDAIGKNIAGDIMRPVDVAEGRVFAVCDQ